MQSGGCATLNFETWVYAYDDEAIGMMHSAACSFSAASVVLPHSTGKERDAESGNDYMFARYYNSATGRFLSPDWSAKEDPVPRQNSIWDEKRGV